MTGYQVTTVIVFLATLVACVILLVLHLPEPAVISALLGGSGLALLPSPLNGANAAAVKASMHPPPKLPSDPPKG